MAFLFTKKNRTHDVQTRIVKHDGESQEQAEVRLASGTAFVKPVQRNWEQRDDAFRGFDSPPGRF